MMMAHCPWMLPTANPQPPSPSPLFKRNRMSVCSNNCHSCHCCCSSQSCFDRRPDNPFNIPFHPHPALAMMYVRARAIHTLDTPLRSSTLFPNSLVSITQATKLLLTGCVPAVEADSSAVGKEVEGMNLDTDCRCNEYKTTGSSVLYTRTIVNAC